MPKCTDGTVEFGRVGRRVVEAAFDGGDIVSDGGVLLLKRADERRSASVLHEVLMQRFIASHAKAPKERVLDVDATHVPLHGEQERGHFYAYCDNYCDNCCYLPPYVFAGQDIGLQRTELAQACTATIRMKLLKIGAAVLRNTRRVRVLLASAHPMKPVFLAVAGALSP